MHDLLRLLERRGLKIDGEKQAAPTFLRPMFGYCNKELHAWTAIDKT